MANPTFMLVIGAKNESGAAFKKAESDAKSFTSSIGAMSKSLIGLAAGYLSVRGLTSAFESVVSASFEAEKSNKLLNAALLRTGLYSAQAKAGIESFATQIQNTTNIDDDMAKSLYSMALNFTPNIDKAKELTQAAIDLSAATGTDVDSAIKQLGGTMSGNLGLLGRIVPQVKLLTEDQLKHGDAVKYVSAAYKGFAAANSDPFTQLGNSFNNFKETLGDLFIKNPVVNEAIKGFISIFEELSKYLKNNKSAMDGIADVTIFIVENIFRVGKAIYAIPNNLVIMFKIAGEAIASSMIAIAGDISGAFAKVAGFLGLDDMSNSLQQNADMLKGAYAEAGKSIDELRSKYIDLTSKDQKTGVAGFFNQAIEGADKLAQRLEALKKINPDDYFKKTGGNNKPPIIIPGKDILKEFNKDLLAAKNQLDGISNVFDDIGAKDPIHQINKHADQLKKTLELLQQQSKDGIINAEGLAKTRAQISDLEAQAKGIHDTLYNLDKVNISIDAVSSGSISGMVSGLGELLGGGVGGAILSAVAKGIELIKALPKIPDSIREDAKAIMTGLKEGLVPAIEFFATEFIDTIIPGIIDAFYEAIAKLVGDLPELIIKSFVSSMKRLIKDIGTQIEFYFVKLPKYIWEGIKKIPDLIVEGFYSIVNLLIDVINSIPFVDIGHIGEDTTKKGTSDSSGNGLVGAQDIQLFKDSMSDFFKSINESLSLMFGHKTEIESTKGSIDEVFRRMKVTNELIAVYQSQELPDLVKSGLDKQSDYAKKAQDLITQYYQKQTDLVHDQINYYTQLRDSVKTAFQGAIDYVSNFGKSASETLDQMLRRFRSSSADQQAKMAGDLANAFQGAFQNNVSAADKELQDAIKNAQNMASSGVIMTDEMTRLIAEAQAQYDTTVANLQKQYLPQLQDLQSKTVDKMQSLIDTNVSQLDVLERGFAGMIGQLQSLTGQSGLKGSYAVGTTFVPETGIYQLHRGERVLTAEQNRSGASQSNMNLTLNITMNGGQTDRSTAENMGKVIVETIKDAFKGNKYGIRTVIQGA